MANLKFPYFFQLKEYFLNNRGISLIRDVFISYDRLEYLIKKLPVPTKRATISLIKVKSCNFLLRVLLACICSYLILVLILYTYHPGTIFA